MSGNLPTPGIMDEITGYADTLTGDVVKAAIDETSANGAKAGTTPGRYYRTGRQRKLTAWTNWRPTGPSGIRSRQSIPRRNNRHPRWKKSMKAFLKKLKEEQ